MIEPVEPDTVYCDVPVIDDGSECAQMCVDTKTLTTDVYGMKSDNEFVNSLEYDAR